ncbi:hypothetical protein N9059_01895, partial [bacterium]|nr:hypothetical protein [bacterium]
QRLHPGDHIKINGHPIYANQGSFRLNALYKFESDPARKQVIHDLLQYIAKLQMARDFPGPFYRKFHSDDEWAKLQNDWNWPDTELHGSNIANRLFEPAMLKDGLATLAHVRFPLGGYHMVMMSEHPELIRKHLTQIWQMLTSVDLDRIAAAETNYLFTVVALHVYAFHFSEQTPEQDALINTFKEMPIVADANIGPTIDVEVVGNLAYSIGKGALRVLDISDPRKPKVLGLIRGLGNTRQLTVSNGIAYVGSREDGVYIVRVKDVVKPKLIGRYDSIEFATGMAISGDILYVALRNYGVELVDVSDPTNPLHLSVVRTGEAQSVAIRDGILYAGVWATSEIVIVDVHQPRMPRIIAKAPLDGFGDGVDVLGNFLYAATGHHSHETHRKEGDPGFGHGHGLEILDISDPAAPRFVSRVKFPPLYEIGNDTWGVTVVNDHAFVGDTFNGMFVVNVADPNKPHITGRTLLPNVKGRDMRSAVGALAPVKDHVLIAGSWSDLHIVDATGIADLAKNNTGTPVQPTPKPTTVSETPGRYRTYLPDGQVHSVAFIGDTAVIACGDDGIHVLQLWPEFKILSQKKTKGFATDISIHGNQVYVAESYGGLSVWQVKDDKLLIPIGRYEVKGRPIKQVEVPGKGRYALLQAGANHFQIVDIQNPASPRLILDESHHGLLYGDQLMRGLVDGRYTAGFWHVSGTWWYDLFNQENSLPAYSGDNHSERFGSPNGLTAIGDKALITVRGGYVLLDRKERRPFKELGIKHIGKQRIHLGKPTIIDDRLYIADRVHGWITIAEISNPEKPKLIEQFVTPGNPGRIHVKRGAMIIPNGRHGLQVFDQ